MTPLSRRSFLGTSGGLALTRALAPARAHGAPADWPPSEGRHTPKLCLGIGSNADDAQMRRFKQIGVDHVLMGGPRVPWTEEALGALVGRFRAGGRGAFLLFQLRQRILQRHRQHRAFAAVLGGSLYRSPAPARHLGHPHQHDEQQEDREQRHAEQRITGEIERHD